MQLKDKRDIVDYLTRELENKCDEVLELNDKLLHLNELKVDEDNKFKVDLNAISKAYEENIELLKNENISLGSYPYYVYVKCVS